MCTRSSSEEYPSSTFCAFLRFIRVIVYYLLPPCKPHLLRARGVGSDLVVVEDKGYLVFAHEEHAVILGHSPSPFGCDEVGAESRFQFFQGFFRHLREVLAYHRKCIIERKFFAGSSIDVDADDGRIWMRATGVFRER